MVTVPPNALIGRITDRMPAILRQEDWPVWLGESDASLADVKALLRTFDDEGAWEMREQAPSKSSKTAKEKPSGTRSLLIISTLMIAGRARVIERAKTFCKKISTKTRARYFGNFAFSFSGQVALHQIDTAIRRSHRRSRNKKLERE